MCEIRLYQLDNHPVDAVKFFKMMMRLEYSMKACGYVKKDLAPDVTIYWDNFANSILTNAFFEKIKTQEIAPTLISCPPRKQCLTKDSELGFGEQPDELKNVCDLLVMLRRVRNNLFHGGKNENRRSDRNDVLVRESINLIIELLKVDDCLRAKFEGL